jgi:hypothetical protein
MDIVHGFGWYTTFCLYVCFREAFLSTW